MAMPEPGPDLSAGLDPQREYAITGARPVNKFRYAENYMVAVYDPSLDLGLWLHLGTCPDDFGQWEEQVLMALPGDGGFLWKRAYSRPPDARKPGGANLAFDVVEPFARMRVSFDGVAVRTPYAEMQADRVRDGRQELLAFDLNVVATGPAWDNHVSAASGSGRGSMEAQSWASEHYQQAFHATGTVRLEGRDIPFDGTGTRDHSRGQRGHKDGVFGGHNLCSAPFASGKAFGLQRMWTPDFQPTLDVGFVYIDGVMHQCDLVSPPVYLRDTRLTPDSFELVMRSAAGEHHIRGSIKKTIFCTLGEPWNYYLGADPRAQRGLFAPGFCEYEWDGEIGWGLAERSGAVGKLPA